MERSVSIASICVLLLGHKSGEQVQSWIRINQLGYLPKSIKVAVLCSNEQSEFQSFSVLDSEGKVVLDRTHIKSSGAFGPFAATYRLDFSTVKEEGTYIIEADGVTSPVFRVSRSVYDGTADKLLYYLRQQRSGYNPFLKDSCHTKDGIIVDHPEKSGRPIDVAGGWHDASDYLQYVTTSANATFCLLMAYRDHAAAFEDKFQANGHEGNNGIPDVLDEARWGLEWLVKMFPTSGEMYHQVADDRDHMKWDLPTRDSSDYGWGPGGARPVYPCTGRPQGLFQYQNRSTGIASAAGKFASAFALGAQVLADVDSEFSVMIKQKALAAYALGKKFPGVCQTAPCRSPYFYEEDNWVDDMELAAAELYFLTDREGYLQDAVSYGEQEPITPWMGQDTARHYQFYPWYNCGHYEVATAGTKAEKRRMADFYRKGIEAVARHANNGFRIGVPFIWCSNNLIASFATQCLLYRRMTGDTQFMELEAAARDWLFGCNPWGVSMVIGLPERGNYAKDPHSAVAKELNLELTGGLLDGPVYASIYRNLRGIRLWD